MFYSITGNVVFADDSSVAVKTGGVAYKINTSLNTLKETGRIGQETTLYTYLSVREDALELYGFSTVHELDIFKLLMTVQGVGPKAALAVLSVHTPNSLILSVVSGDSKSISKAQGVGAKTAQRIILELKDKFSKMVPEQASASDFTAPVFTVTGNIAEAESALISLGYSHSDAVKALSGLDSSDTVENLIRSALRKLI